MLVHDADGQHPGYVESLDNGPLPRWQDGLLLFPGGAKGGVVNLGSNDDLLHGPTFAISLDIRPDLRDQADEAVLLCNRHESQVVGGLTLRYQRKLGRMRFSFADGRRIHELQAPYDLPAGRWSQVQVSYDGSRLSMARDGQTIAEKTIYDAILRVGSTPLLLGGYHDGRQQWHGSLRNLHLAMGKRTRGFAVGTDLGSTPAPVIDGDLGDGCWDRRWFDSGFADLGSMTASDCRTEFSIRADGLRVYIAIRAFGQDPRTIRPGTERVRDGDTFLDDSVEIFLDPDRSGEHYFHFCLNAGNVLYDALVKRKGKDQRPDYNANLVSATRILADSWQAELSIAYADLGIAPTNDRTWLVNICRNRTSSDHKHSTWGRLNSNDKPGGFNDVRLFRSIPLFPIPPQSSADAQGTAAFRSHWGLDDPDAAAGFGMRAVNKTMMVANNMTLPNFFESEASFSDYGTSDIEYILDLPAGITLVAMGKTDQDDTWTISPGTEAAHDGSPYTRYALKAVKLHRLNKIIGPVFMRSTLPDDATVCVYYFARSTTSTQAVSSLPVTIRRMPTPGPPKHLYSGIAWLFVSSWRAWPEFLENYPLLGFNSVASNSWSDRKIPDLGRCLDQARSAGLTITATDPTFTRLGSVPEARSLLSGTSANDPAHDVCPSYRGSHYHDELSRLAAYVAITRPDYLFLDIECHDHGGFLGKTRQCSRCVEAIGRSGLDPADSMIDLGNAMIKDLKDCLALNAPETVAHPPRIGIYHTNAGGFVYQNTFSFDRLAAAGLLDLSMPTLYSASKAMEFGNLMRRQRAALPSGGTIAWTTSGFIASPDQIEYPSAWVYDYALEGFANGNLGVAWFSTGTFDTADLFYFSKAMQSIIPVEGLLSDPQLQTGQVTIDPPEVKGNCLQSHGATLLLLSDYRNGTVGGDLSLAFPQDMHGEVYSLAERRVVGTCLAGKARFSWTPGVAGAHTALYYIGDDAQALLRR